MEERIDVTHNYSTHLLIITHVSTSDDVPGHARTPLTAPLRLPTSAEGLGWRREGLRSFGSHRCLASLLGA